MEVLVDREIASGHVSDRDRPSAAANRDARCREKGKHNFSDLLGSGSGRQASERVRDVGRRRARARAMGHYASQKAGRLLDPIPSSISRDAYGERIGESGREHRESGSDVHRNLHVDCRVVPFAVFGTTLDRSLAGDGERGRRQAVAVFGDAASTRPRIA